ncbi:MAG: hypothetical protein IIZ33_03740 [Erysipelotrichaceae bacterium]|nr:hypothetical protein [Erysipelotrichaceae bacterium]
MLLNEFFKDAPAIEISQLSCDSRMPMKDAIFFCVKGIRDDGHQFVKDAIINGAKVIVYEDDIDTSLNAVFIRVSNVLDVLNKVADRFYGYPADSMETYIVSGCRGRSSVTSFINQLISRYRKCGSIGIMGISYSGHWLMNSYSTLPVLSNLSYLSAMKEDDVEACTFEASPLNLAYKKLTSVHPDVFIYTSTSLQAQDYKELGNDYYNFLRKYFYTLEENTLVIFNRDDPSFEELRDAPAKYLTYGFDEEADFRIYDINIRHTGTSFALRYKGKNVIISSPLLGVDNVYNLTAAISGLVAMGYDLESLVNEIATIKPVEGIYDRLDDPDYHIITDAAYTLDSIRDIFDFGRYLTPKKNKLIAMVGINYTDDAKRLEGLSALANKYLDMLIITEDDSYEHDTLSILNRMKDYDLSCRSLIIEDRENAIEEGIELLNRGDMFLLIGKGNEVSLYKGLGREYYEGDKKIAGMYLKKRKEEEENETFEVY